MVYSAQMRAAVGAVRTALSSIGLDVQDSRFMRHGEHEPAPDAPLVLVACSGGRDSMALAAVSRTVCASLGVRCGAIVVDHGLQVGSDEIAAATVRRCEALGLDPVLYRSVAVNNNGAGIESAARDARYEALVSACHTAGAVAVLLAHTRDDQAETVLLGLLRSGGVDAIAGMPTSFTRGGVQFLRPLLDIGRADTTAICRQLNLQWWDDPTNGDSIDGLLPPCYPLRSRIRHDLLPMMERFAGADVVTHLARNTTAAQYDKSYLDEAADKALEEVVRLSANGDSTLTFDARRLGDLHPAIRRRVIAHALGMAGIPCNLRQIESIERLACDWHGQGGVNLSGGYSANRQKHVILVCQDGMHENRRRSRSNRP